MCGTCTFAAGSVQYDGNDFLAKGAPCPDWWKSLEVGDCKSEPSQVALVFAGGKEACCTFCIEYNRRNLQPPCTHASFGPSSQGVQNLCYAKTGPPSKLTASNYPRASFLAGLPCATYHPPGPVPWGFTFLLAMGFLLVGYFAGGTRLGARRHPHSHAWHKLWGLVIDGYNFAYLGMRSSEDDSRDCGGDRGGSSGGKEAARQSQLALLSEPGGTETAAPRRATRGVTTPLHQAVVTGSTSKVQGLLTRCPPSGINAGDKRSFTPFHIACAGGHVEIVELLLAAGCDAGLTNDGGYDGWELASSLHRTEVVALRAETLRQGEASMPSSRGREKRSGRRKHNKQQQGGQCGAVASAAAAGVDSKASQRVLL